MKGIPHSNSREHQRSSAGARKLMRMRAHQNPRFMAAGITVVDGLKGVERAILPVAAGGNGGWALCFMVSQSTPSPHQNKEFL